MDCVLRALDRRLEEAGASRGSKALGHKVKSSVKAYIPVGEEEVCRGWCTDYIVDTCEVIPSAEAASKVLGVEPNSKLSQQFEEVTAKVARLHANIEETRDAGVEMVLKSECVGVSKVVHILRASGDRLGSDELGKWDKHMRDSLGRTLNGDLDDHSWRQAVSGFWQGGLGWRTGLDLALPAFLASRVASRPAVESLLSNVVDAGMGDLETLLEVFDARTTEALERAVSSLPDDLALNFRGMVIDAAAAAITRWRLLTMPENDAEGGRAELHALLQEAFLADDGELGADRSTHVAGPLQRGLCSVVDAARGRVWDEVLRSQGRWEDVRRLRELRNVADQNRSWLWAIKSRAELCLASHDYTLAVRTMLGAPVLIDPVRLWWVWETRSGLARETRALLYGFCHNDWTQSRA